MPTVDPTIHQVAARDGTPLAARRWAGDPTLGYVLVHGLASNLETWGEVAGLLADAGHAVVAYDQRGHGRSGPAGPEYGLEKALDDLDEVLAWSGFERAVLAGQSWGGNLVLGHAALRQGAEAVAGVDGGTIDLHRRFDDWEAAADALRPPVLRVGMAEVEARIRAAHPDWSDQGVAATLANLRADADGVARNRLALESHLQVLQIMWDHPPTDWYADVHVPVLLLLAGDGDDAARAAAASATPPTATVGWVAGDHDLHVQQPVLVARRLLDPGWR